MKFWLLLETFRTSAHYIELEFRWHFCVNPVSDWIGNYSPALLCSFQKRSLIEKNSHIKVWFDLLNPWFNILCTQTYQRCCISIQSWWIIISIGGTKTLVCFAKDCFRSCSNCSSRRKFIGSLISETQKIGWYWDIKVSFGRVVNCNSNYHISFFIFLFFCLDKVYIACVEFVIDWYFQVLFFCLFFRIMCEIVDR